MNVASVAEMRGLDKKAIEQYGISEEILMENAGHAVYSLIRRIAKVCDEKYLVFAGIGNNGGDGLVIARKLHSEGGIVKVAILGDPSRYRGAALTNYGILKKLPIEVEQIDTLEQVPEDIRRSDVVIDAIFGTGLTRNVDGIYGEVIKLINAHGKLVISVDIPSGINGDNGHIMSSAVKADKTVTFGLPKRGILLYPGFEMCGDIYVSHISFPAEMYSDDGIKVSANVTGPIPQRKKDGHKGSFGDALFIAGSENYFGAPYFSALSFLKAGGGYSRLAAPKAITPFIASMGSEIVFIPMKGNTERSIGLENIDALLELSEKVDVVVTGPGISLNEETARLVRELVSAVQKPMIIDGDGITALCCELDKVKKREYPTVLTPHLGEMARISGMSIRHIKDRPVEILQETSENLNAYVVMKGAHSLVGYPDKRIFINMSGNSGMATAGSGDVLTGTIAAMFGLGMEFPDAIRKGVFIHGLAGDLAALDKGEDGMTARDIMEYLPHALKMERKGLEEPACSLYSGCTVI